VVVGRAAERITRASGGGVPGLVVANNYDGPGCQIFGDLGPGWPGWWPMAQLRVVRPAAGSRGLTGRLPVNGRAGRRSLCRAIPRPAHQPERAAGQPNPAPPADQGPASGQHHVPPSSGLRL